MKYLTLFIFFGTESKSEKMWNNGYRSLERGSRFLYEVYYLCNEAIKILGTYFSYIRIKEECFQLGFQECFKIVSNVQGTSKLWRFWKLTLEGWTVVFKSLAISKLISQALTAPVPTYIAWDSKLLWPFRPPSYGITLISK